MKAVGLILISKIDMNSKIIKRAKIWSAGINNDSDKLTDTSIIFLDKDALSFLTKNSYDCSNND